MGQHILMGKICTFKTNSISFNRIKVQGDRINGIVFQHTIELLLVVLFKNKIGENVTKFLWKYQYFNNNNHEY